MGEFDTRSPEPRERPAVLGMASASEEEQGRSVRPQRILVANSPTFLFLRIVAFNVGARLGIYQNSVARFNENRRRYFQTIVANNFFGNIAAG